MTLLAAGRPRRLRSQHRRKRDYASIDQVPMLNRIPPAAVLDAREAIAAASFRSPPRQGASHVLIVPVDDRFGMPSAFGGPRAHDDAVAARHPRPPPPPPPHLATPRPHHPRLLHAHRAALGRKPINETTWVASRDRTFLGTRAPVRQCATRRSRRAPDLNGYSRPRLIRQDSRRRRRGKSAPPVRQPMAVASL